MGVNCVFVGKNGIEIDLAFDSLTVCYGKSYFFHGYTIDLNAQKIP